MSASGNKNCQVVNKIITSEFLLFYYMLVRLSEYRVHVGLKSLKLDFQCMQGLSSEKM